MERMNTTGSTDVQSSGKFYLPGSSDSGTIETVERFLTTLFRSRDELRTLVRTQRR